MELIAALVVGVLALAQVVIAVRQLDARSWPFINSHDKRLQMAWAAGYALIGGVALLLYFLK